jgi:hypothetical protein
MAFDISELQGLLSQFGPSEEEKRAAKMQAISQFGFGLLGAPKGQVWQRAGLSALNAMQGQSDALHNVTQQKMQSMQAAGQAMGLQETMRKFADDDQARKILMKPPQAPNGTQGMQNPAGVASAPNPASSSLYTQLLAKADALEQGGLPQKAQEYRVLAEKYAPKYKGTETVMRDGKPVLLQQYENQAPTEMSGYGPKPDYKQVDTGGQVGFYDPVTGQGGGSFGKTNSPDAMLSSDTARRGQNMTDARSREFNANAASNSGQVVETATGFARIGKDNTVTPIVANGQQIQAKPSGAVQQQIANNQVTLSKIDRALGLIDKTPNAFGVKNMLGDPIMQRIDPSGVDARSIVADIAGQKIHDRSGGAVSVGESERLKPYVPNVTDDASTVKKKLANFKREYTQMQQELAGGRSVAEVSDRRTRGQPSIEDLVSKYAK